MARNAIGSPAQFKFPHEKGGESIDEPEDLSIEIEGNPSATDPFKKEDEKKETKKAPDDDLDIEIEDDTPPEDRGRTPSDPPEDPTDDELEEYSEKVRKRIKHFTKGYHDERRAKEAALREREEAIAYAQKLREENEQLKQYGQKSQETMLSHAEQTLAKDLAAAEEAYKEAYEAGNAVELLAAQKALHQAQLRQDRLSELKQRQSRQAENTVQSEKPVVQTRQEPQRDERAEKWRENNTWFGADEEMTAFALGYHQKLVKQGVDPTSDDYYEKINSRMQQVFPEYFDTGDDMEEQPKKAAKSETVVAPATRSRGPRKVKLTETQVRLAKRLGVPLQEYARQVAIQERAERNG